MFGAYTPYGRTDWRHERLVSDGVARDMIEVIHISQGGPTDSIQVGGATYYYEHHPYCGICPCNKNGTERVSPWPKRVWDAVQAKHNDKGVHDG